MGESLSLSRSLGFSALANDKYRAIKRCKFPSAEKKICAAQRDTYIHFVIDRRAASMKKKKKYRESLITDYFRLVSW